MKHLRYLTLSILIISLSSFVKSGDSFGPFINGQTSYTFYGYGPNSIQVANGTVTATPGTTVTVRLSPDNSVVGNGYNLDFILSGASFTYNSSNPSTNALVLTEPGSSVYATFTMPASGSVTWNGQFIGDVNGNSASIQVY